MKSTRAKAAFVALFSAATIAALIYFFVPFTRSSDLIQVNLRLQWVKQAQFAGYIVADKLGYYHAEGLNVHIRPAGPDLKSMSTVAAGTDDIGIGVSNQVALARSNGVPVKIIAQIFQDSANRYVLLRKNQIHDLEQLRGKKVGLWLGGDEAEFIAMLNTAGMKLADVDVIPQGYSVTPFLNGDYVLSEVTVYNELIQVEDTLGGAKQLQIISPEQYDDAIVGDMIFVMENTIRNRPDMLVRFLRASLRGWKYAIAHPNKTVDIILKENPELNRDQQLKQLKAVDALILHDTPISEIGRMKLSAYATTIRILRQSGQLSNSKVKPVDMFDPNLLRQAR